MIVAWLLLGCPMVTEADLDVLRDVDGDGEPGLAFDGRDCDDGDASIGPEAEEVWYDGIDQNCDGADDFDQDGDGVRVDGEDPDCDDTDPRVGDAALSLYADADGDGYGAGVASLRCVTSSGWVADDTDCDDTRADVFPGASDAWYDGVDANCDGANDYDQDADGLVEGEDCDDGDAATLGPQVWFQDGDGDGFGDETSTVEACDAPAGFVADATDCDDLNAFVRPSAVEVCDGANVDENCNNAADDADVGTDPSTMTAWWVDGDMDGWGGEPAPNSCDGGPGEVAQDGDCDDEDADAHPGARWHADRDRDGYGDEDDGVFVCDRLAGRIAQGGDCDDDDPEIHEGAYDPSGDLIDQDCGRDTELDVTGDGLPDPLTDVLAEDVFIPDIGCPAVTGVVVVPSGGSIQDAIDGASSCDRIEIEDGVFEDFVVDRPLVITAALGARPIIQGGAGDVVGIDVQDTNVVISGLTVRDYPVGVQVAAGTLSMLELLTLEDNDVGVLASDAAALMYGIDVKGGVAAVVHSGPVLVVSDSSMRGVQGIAGVINSEGPPGGGRVRLQRVEIADSTANGLLGSVYAVTESVALVGVDFVGNTGPQVALVSPQVILRGVTIEDCVTLGAQLVKATAHELFDPPTALEQAEPGYVPSAIEVDRLRVVGNGVATLASDDAALVQLDWYHTTEMRRSAIVGNRVLQVLGSATSFRWLMSNDYEAFLPPSPTRTRVLEHIAVGADLGVGITTTGAAVAHVTVVGLDGAFSLQNPLGASNAMNVVESIVWDNGALWDGRDVGFFTSANGSIADSATPAGGCPGCDSRDPAFLRYQDGYPAELWELTLAPSSPYLYYNGVDPDPAVLPCAASVGNEAIAQQIGAYGDRGGLSQPPDPSRYDDCDDDGMYDGWEVEYLAFDPGIDTDGDGLINIDEFENGGLPTSRDSDGDEVFDSDDLDAGGLLDPCVPNACGP